MKLFQYKETQKFNQIMSYILILFNNNNTLTRVH